VEDCHVQGSAVGDDVIALELLTRTLVGVALESLDVLGGRVSLAQFRLLLRLDELGKVPSSRLAAALGLGASSVTRMVDRLQAADLVVRGGDPGHRGVVTVELTPEARQLVATVVRHRHRLLATLLNDLTVDERAAVVRAAGHLAGTDDVATSGILPL
jgi:DNA-binding MarR family transcriptional regulator